MDPESKPSSKNAQAAPFATASKVGDVKDNRDVSTVSLISFSPTPNIKGKPPVNGIDSATPNRHRIFRSILVLGVVAFACVALLIGPKLYHSFKIWRATALAKQSEGFLEANQIEKASFTLRSAYILSPDAPEVVRAMARLLSNLNISSATAYWNWLLDSKNATDTDRRAAAAWAMRSGHYNDASIIIQDLLARDSKDARNQFLAARWSADRGTPAMLIHYARSAVNDDPTFQPAAFFLAVHELDNIYLHQEGINSLFQFAQANDDSGLLAMHYLALDSHLKPAEIDRLIARLKSHPLAGEAERISALELSIKRQPDRRKKLIDQAMADHEKIDPVDQTTFAEWLNSNGEAERTLEFIPRERALSNKDLFTAYMDALGVLKRWAELKKVLSGVTVPLEFPYIELYLSRCDSEMGHEESSDLHWQKAVFAAADNPIQRLHLAAYAEKRGQNERAAAVYRTLTQENPSIARVAYLGLLRVLSDKDVRSLRDVLDQMVSRWPNDDEMANQYVFLNLLLNEHVKEMHQRALQLLADDSYSVSHRSNVALACLRLNDPAGAYRVYAQGTTDWNTAPLPDLIVYAATLNANGYTQSAHRLLLSINRHDLRPEFQDLVKSIP